MDSLLEPVNQSTARSVAGHDRCCGTTAYLAKPEDRGIHDLAQPRNEASCLQQSLDGTREIGTEQTTPMPTEEDP